MSFKRLLIVLTFAVTMVTTMLLGTSYAWYQFDNAVTTFSGVETFENIDGLAIIFTNKEDISTNVGIPILASEVAERSEKTKFTITPSSSLLSGKEVAFQISLVDLEIDSALTSVTDLKYSLLETIGTGSTTTIASGNFNNFTDDTLVLKAMTKITTFDVEYSYEFRLWLEETGGDQNNLMGKSITGRIKVSSVVR